VHKYPIGLIAKTDCFRVFSSVFTKDCEKFVLSRMKASSTNIKPVIVIDETTKECICKIPNNTLTGFTLATDTNALMLCVKIHAKTDYMIKKFHIQISDKTPEQKEKAVDELLKGIT
jgi:hypothetical protein